MIVTGLPSGPSAVEPERVGVLAAELEDVAHLDAPRDDQRRAAARAAVAVADLDRADLALGHEVAAAHHERGVLAGLVRAGDPGDALDDERVDQVADLPVGQLLRADVALDQLGVLGQIGRLGLRHLGRLELSAEPLHVHLAVAGHADDEQLPLGRSRRPGLDDQVLQRVGGGERRVRGRVRSAGRPACRSSACRGCRAPRSAGCAAGSSAGGAAISTASVLAA